MTIHEIKIMLEEGNAIWNNLTEDEKFIFKNYVFTKMDNYPIVTLKKHRED